MLYASTNAIRWCVCVPTGSRNFACFEVGLIRTVMDNVTGNERAA